MVGQVSALLLIAHHWAFATTYRLYLEHRINPPERPTATQQFEIEEHRVVPRIVTRGPDRLAFATDARADAHVRVELRPESRASYEIVWRDGSSSRTLAQGMASSATPIDGFYPTGRGVIELASDEPVVWADPRVERVLVIWPQAALFGICSGWLLMSRRDMASARRLVFRAAAVAIGCAGSVLASEAVLRALGAALPAGIAAQRHDLGEVTADPQWLESPRYGRRLRANVDTLNEWRFGDIVRLGYVPQSVSPGRLHQFTFHTDAEGFRNRGVRERFEIAALGDSFTDAMTMRADDSWPSRLERTLGVAVQNYGTAGFGPQQELLVLKDYVAARRPRRVVLAFFAGNDLFDAEAFDDFQRSDGRSTRAAPGWRIKEIVDRADTWFVVNALQAGWRRFDRESERGLRPSTEEPRAVGTDGEEAVASFDRGMFDVPVNGTRVQFAFMPPYLNTLNFSAANLRARRGWRLTAAAIRDMRDVSASFGATFLVMFIPFKSQVYLGLVERAFKDDERRRAFRFYLDVYQRPVDLAAMSRNRFAQNGLMRELCEREGIPMLDLSPTLEARVVGGDNMYFPDESHLNEAGETVAAETLAAFLRTLRLE
jgi:lysophospholipase L1-like esterase